MTEAEYMQEVDRFICYRVNKFARSGDNWQRNKEYFEDMTQEARLQVIRHIRVNGMAPPARYYTLCGVITNACFQVIRDYQAVKVPVYWISSKPIRDSKQADTPKCYQLDDSTIQKGMVTESMDDAVIASVMIDRVITDPSKPLTDKHKAIIGHLLEGHTPYSIQKNYGIHHQETARCMAKVKQHIQD